MPRIDLDILNQKQTPAFYASSLATRPSYGFVGRIFIDSDSPSTGLYRDTGSSWESIATPGSATPTLQSVTTAGSSTNVGITVTSNGIGIGTTIPGANILDIHGTTGVLAQLENTTTQNSLLSFRNQGAGAWSVGNSYNAGANDFIIYDAVSFANRLTIKNNGNVLINSSTDSGEKLQVTGTSKFTGNINANSSVILNSNFSIGSAVQSGGIWRAPGNGPGTNFNENMQASQISWQFASLYGSPGTKAINNTTGKSVFNINVGLGNSNTNNTDASVLLLDGAHNLTLFTGTIIRGIYYNPTLTSLTGVVSHRAIQTETGDCYFGTTSGNTLIGTTTDNGKKLQVNGTITTAGFAASGEVLTVSATLSEQYYHVFTGAVGQTLTLLSPSSNNLQYVIINNSANTVTVAAAASTNIVNTVGSSVATITLIANQRVFIIADGNNKYYQIF
jgi:hypothetical protein